VAAQGAVVGKKGGGPQRSYVTASRDERSGGCAAFSDLVSFQRVDAAKGAILWGPGWRPSIWRPLGGPDTVADDGLSRLTALAARVGPSLGVGTPFRPKPSQQRRRRSAGDASRGGWGGPAARRTSAQRIVNAQAGTLSKKTGLRPQRDRSAATPSLSSGAASPRKITHMDGVRRPAAGVLPGPQALGLAYPLLVVADGPRIPRAAPPGPSAPQPPEQGA